jgi:hypothetical protein
MIVKIVQPPLDAAVSLIPLRPGGWAVVDPEDYDRLIIFKWFVKRSGGRFYACRKFIIKHKEQIVFMHREIMQPEPWLIVHHRNWNSLDNRKSNLQIVTQREHRHFDGYHIF